MHFTYYNIAKIEVKKTRLTLFMNINIKMWTQC